VTVPEAVVADSYRRRVAAHMAGTGVLKPIAFIAYGDGGHNPDNTAKPADSGAADLSRAPDALRRMEAGRPQERGI
jgi:hypothetical protein